MLFSSHRQVSVNLPRALCCEKKATPSRRAHVTSTNCWSNLLNGMSRTASCFQVTTHTPLQATQSPSAAGEQKINHVVKAPEIGS